MNEKYYIIVLLSIFVIGLGGWLFYVYRLFKSGEKFLKRLEDENSPTKENQSETDKKDYNY